MNDSSTQVALLSAFIALCALGLTVWQGLLQRRHFRISVRPHFVFVRDHQADQPKIEMLNSGLGPGAVRSLVAKFGDKTYNLSLPQSEWPQFVSDVLSKQGISTADLIIQTSSPGKGYFLQPGWRQPLLLLKVQNSSPQAAALAIELVASVKFDIEYECLYGEKYQ